MICHPSNIEPSNTEPKTINDTQNTIADVGVTIEGLHVAEDLAVGRVQLIHLQDNRMFWIPYHRTSLVWAFFLLHLQGIKVDVKVPQTMRCVLCRPTSSTSMMSEGQSSIASQPTTRSKVSLSTTLHMNLPL